MVQPSTSWDMLVVDVYTALVPLVSVPTYNLHLPEPSVLLVQDFSHTTQFSA